MATTLTVNAAPSSHQFVAEVWADNWFELHVNGKLVGSDSIPIETERSFNSERIKFWASYPLTIGLVAKDYVENESGLEYIGTNRQQIGDGGIIFQIKDLVTSRVIATSNSTWRVLILNTAPLNPECSTSQSPLLDCKSANRSKPKGWNLINFDSSKWKSATTYTASEVGVKEGYFDSDWAPKAKLIWSSDLKLDNTLLIRKTIKSG